MGLEQNYLVGIVTDAVDAFIKENPNLLNIDAHEQTITHRLAVHIERNFRRKNYHVDCEYNKNLGEPKLIEIDGLDEEARASCGCRVCRNIVDDIQRERRFRPDIIVHRRGSNHHNMIAVEVKKGVFCPFDEAKLLALTGRRHEYNYSLGAFIYFLEQEPIFKFYSNGVKIS